MTVTTVPVRVSVYDQVGDPIAGGRITARLDKTEISGAALVFPELTESTTDAAGVCILNLWPNALGSSSSSYRIQAYHPDTGRRCLDAQVVVPNSPCRLEEILQLEPFPPRDAAQQALIALQAAQAGISDQAQATADQAGLADDARAGSDTAAVAALTHAQAAALSRLELEVARNDALDAGQQADAGAARAESAADRAESADLSATEQARIATVKAELASSQAGRVDAMAHDLDTAAQIAQQQAQACAELELAARGHASDASAHAGIANSKANEAGDKAAAALGAQRAAESAAAEALQHRNAASGSVALAQGAAQQAKQSADTVAIQAEAVAEFARATAADRTQTGLDRQAVQASTESFVIHFSQMATSLIETQAIVISHHAFQ